MTIDKEITSKKKISVTIAVIVLIVGVFLLILSTSDELRYKDHEVECYDKYGHEIIGSKCISQDYKSPYLEIIDIWPVLILLGLIIIFFEVFL